MPDIYDRIIEDGFGLVNLGSHRGLYYAPAANASNTPGGWLFIAVEDRLTSSRIRQHVAEFLNMVMGKK